MNSIKRLGCLGVWTIALLYSSVLYADNTEKAQKSEAQIRWEATSPIANLYLKHAPASEFVFFGDKEKQKWNNYAGALMYYLAATDRDAKNVWGPYQAAASLAYLDVPEKAKVYLDEANKRGFWQYLIAQEDQEMGAVKNTREFKRLLANAKKRYASHAQDAGKAMIQVPDKVAPKSGWPVLVWLSGYGTQGTDSQELGKALVGDRAIFIGINGTEKLDEHRFRWSRKNTSSTYQAVHKALITAQRKAKIDWSKVALIGFSQGALHAAHLMAEHGKVYCGAIIVSPAGVQTDIQHAAPKGKRIILSYGNKESADDLNLDFKLNAFFTPNNHLKISTHEGGHFFDDKWKERYPDYVGYVLGLTPAKF